MISVKEFTKVQRELKEAREALEGEKQRAAGLASDATAAGHDQRSAAQLREELDHYKKQVEELKELCRGGSGSGDSASGDGDSDQVAALQRRVRELKDAHGRDLRDMFDKLAAKEEEVARARQASESLRRAEMDMDDLKDEVNVLRMARDRFRAEAEELGQRLEEEGAQASGATADAASRAEQAEAEVERLRAALEEEQRKRAAQEKESSVELATVREKLKTATRRRAEADCECAAAEARAAQSEEARAAAEGEGMKLRARVQELEGVEGAVREEAERGWMGVEETQQRLGASREAEESLRRELGKQRMRADDAERAATESSRRVRSLETELEEAKNATKDLALEHKIASRRSVNLIKDLKQQLARAKRAKEEVQQRCDTLESQLAEAKAQRDLQQPPQARGERFSGAEVARSASSPNVREAAANERPASAGAVDAAGSSAGGARTAQAHSGKEREIIQALAHRLEALLQENAAVREKVAFLERNGHLLAEDLEEKKRLLAQFTSADKNADPDKAEALAETAWKESPAVAHGLLRSTLAENARLKTDLKLLGEQTMALKDLLREQENGS